MSLLEVERINSFYGDSHILFDVSIEVGKNEVVALLGRNGAGKTTTLRTIMGVLAPHGGKIRLDGREIQGLPPYEIARMGLQLVPEERAIFGQLTVEENLRLAALTAEQPWSLDRIYEFFPRVKERRRSRGHQLSGGEQQMLAIARALLLNPTLLMLDEPTQGLAPIMIRQVLAALQSLKGRFAMVVVEQNRAFLDTLADLTLTMRNGRLASEPKGNFP
jgi:branched-chain amino acid transport system ATP-binding protein